MEEKNKFKSGTRQDWQVYWQSTRAGEAFTRGGTDHPAVSEFWHKLFQRFLSERQILEIVDIASGSGAVTQYAANVLSRESISLSCIDISFDAVRGIVGRWPSVHGIVADAAAIPLAPGSVDIATSQFGVEYAGVDAVRELISIVRPGGKVAVLLHYKFGAIYQQCAANYAAIREVQRIGFVEDAITMFESAFAVLSGADRQAYEETSRKLIPGFRSMEKVMRRYGKHVAGDTVRRLYLDINHIHSRLPAYQEDDVLIWLRRMVVELQTYAGRMSSMCDAAMDERGFRTLEKMVRSSGFVIHISDPLYADELDLPLAWSLVASKLRGSSQKVAASR